MRPSWLTEGLLEVQCLSARRVTGGTGKYQGMDQTGKFNLAMQKPALPGLLAFFTGGPTTRCGNSSSVMRYSVKMWSRC